MDSNEARDVVKEMEQMGDRLNDLREEVRAAMQGVRLDADKAIKAYQALRELEGQIEGAEEDLQGETEDADILRDAAQTRGDAQGWAHMAGEEMADIFNISDEARERLDWPG